MNRVDPEAVVMVPIDGGYHVWTKRVGEGGIPLLTLHGGPGFTHEIFEGLAAKLPARGIDVILYDQLGSYHSDQPQDPGLWTVERFTDEVEQVRSGLGLDEVVLMGLSWGGMLAIEYALRYPQHLRGLVVVSMTASIAAYQRSVDALRDRLPPDVKRVLREHERAGLTEDPEYVTLVDEHLNRRHVCRVVPWPESVQRMFRHAALAVYHTMQGPNEFVVTGTLASWDRWDDIGRISAPTHLIVGRHDTISVDDVREMTRRIAGATMTVCEQGSHFSMWDDPEAFEDALVRFVHTVGAGSADG
jgi:proline iminopeptidase